MTVQRDPYPESLDDVPFAPPREGIDPQSFEGEVLRVLNRIAVALEGRTVTAQNAPQQPRPALTPLPAVQTVENRPACPYHGVDKVRTSTQGPGFFCSAKAMQGQPANPKGYCTWHS